MCLLYIKNHTGCLEMHAYIVKGAAVVFPKTCEFLPLKSCYFKWTFRKFSAKIRWTNVVEKVVEKFSIKICEESNY